MIERAAAATDFTLIVVLPGGHLHLEGVTLQRGRGAIYNTGRLDVADSLSKLQRVCDAADENGLGVENPDAWLACFQVRAKPPSIDGTLDPTIDQLFSTSEFGTEQLSTRRKYEVCIPALRLP